MKVVAPCPWVDDFLGVASWPPKGKKTVGQYIASWEEQDSIECPLKDVQFTTKNQKGSKEPLRRSPRKRINIDQSSSEPGPSKKSSTPRAQSSTKYRDGGSSFNKMTNKHK